MMKSSMRSPIGCVELVGGSSVEITPKSKGKDDAIADWWFLNELKRS